MNNTKKTKKELKESLDSKIVCSCGNDSFRVYIDVIIDDARLYCSKCGKEDT